MYFYISKYRTLFLDQNIKARKNKIIYSKQNSEVDLKLEARTGPTNNSSLSAENSEFSLPKQVRPYNNSAISHFASAYETKKMSINSPHDKYISINAEIDFDEKEPNIPFNSSNSKVKFMTPNATQLHIENADRSKIRVRSKKRMRPTICSPDKINKIRETFYSLSSYCKKLEGDSKPAFEKCELDRFENEIKFRDFIKTLNIFEEIEYASDDLVKALYEYVKSTKESVVNDAIDVINSYHVGKIDPTSIVARLERETRKRSKGRKKN